MYGSSAVVLLLCSVAEASMGFRAGRTGNHGSVKFKHLQPQAENKVNASKDLVRLNAVKANSTGSEKAPIDPCACEFRGECTCQSSLEFMDCISNACASGGCDCHEHQYHNACVDMANTCVSLEFKCSSMKAVCTMTTSEKEKPKVAELSDEVIQDELKDLIKKKCKLEEAEKDGWLNADNRLREIEPEIEHHVEVLKSRKADVPDVNDCSPKEPAKKAEEIKEKPAPPAKSMAMTFKSAFASMPLLALTMYAL